MPDAKPSRTVAHLGLGFFVLMLVLAVVGLYELFNTGSTAPAPQVVQGPAPTVQAPALPQVVAAPPPALAPCATVRGDGVVVYCDMGAGSEGYIKREGGLLATCVWPLPDNSIYEYFNLIVSEGEVPYSKPHSNTLTGIHFKVKQAAKIKAQLLPWGQNCEHEPP